MGFDYSWTPCQTGTWSSRVSLLHGSSSYLTFAIVVGNNVNQMDYLNRLVVSVAWVAHIVIYLLIDPPLSAFVNEVFIKLDDIWGNWKILLFFWSTGYLLTIQLLKSILISFGFRSSWNRSICCFLLLSLAVCDHWSNDDWTEVGFYYNPSYEVCIFVVFLFSSLRSHLFSHCF